VDYSQPSVYQFTGYSERVAIFELAIMRFIQLLFVTRLAVRKQTGHTSLLTDIFRIGWSANR
jgi:hypothetical protein